MAVNLRRGLLRTWVVASVLWVVGASIGAYFVLRDEVAVLTGERPASQGVIKCDETTDQALRPLCDFQGQLQETIRKLDEPRYIERREEAWANIGWGAAAVVGPPILVLLFTSAGLWVIRGFR